MKITIEVAGGIVTQVWSDTKDLVVEVLDWDNITRDESVSEKDETELVAAIVKETPFQVF